MPSHRRLLLAAGVLVLVALAAGVGSVVDERQRVRACEEDPGMLCGFEHGFAAAISRSVAAGVAALAVVLGIAALVGGLRAMPGWGLALVVAVVAGVVALAGHLAWSFEMDAAATCDSAARPSCYVPHWQLGAMAKAARNVGVAAALVAVLCAVVLGVRRGGGPGPDPARQTHK